MAERVVRDEGRMREIGFYWTIEWHGPKPQVQYWDGEHWYGCGTEEFGDRYDEQVTVVSERLHEPPPSV